MKSQKKRFNILFLFYAALGIFWMFDYGIPLDELTQRHIGIENARFISGNIPADVLEENGYFGPVFETIAYVFEQLIYNADLSTKIWMRHFLLFAIFLLAIRAFYKMAKRLETIAGSALLATLLFALYPRIFADAHYNSKDTLFLCLVVFSWYYLFEFIATGNKSRWIISAVILGVSASVRLNAFFILAAVTIVIPFVFASKIWQKAKLLFWYFLFFVLGLFAFYPYLWIHPIESLGNLFVYSSQNPWPWKTLALQKDILPGKLPWWYLFVWMGVTIPLLQIILFIWSAGLTFAKENKVLRAELGIILLSFCIPIVGFIFLRPTIYNGWRHMQFLLVPLSLLTVLVWNRILNWRFASWFKGGAVLYTLASFLYWQPYGYAYFNELYTATGKTGSFDQDYWGLSTLQATKWIVKHEYDDSIFVYAFPESAEMNAGLLKEKYSKRIHFTAKRFARYEIELRRNRWFSESRDPVVFSIAPGRDTLVRVLRLK